MKRLVRNTAILFSGIALIPAAAGVGYEVGFDPNGEDAIAADDYQQCARELGATAASQLLPNDCQTLVVYRDPAKHRGQVYPSSFSAPASEFKLDQQGYDVAKSQVETDWKESVEGSIIGGTLLWALAIGGQLLMDAEKSESKA